MTVQNIISQALENYDKTRPTIKYLLNETFLKIDKSNSNQRIIFNFYDNKTKKLLLESEVEIIAIYYDKLHVWSWAWSHPGLMNSENFLSKEILLYSLKLEDDMAYIKNLLCSSRGIINDITQIDINLAIGSDIIKKHYIYPLIHNIDNSNLIYYYILIDTDKLDKLSINNDNDFDFN
jgi:hypothetical protein